MGDISDLLDLKRFPIHHPDTPAYAALVARCQADLARTGMFNLEGFMRPEMAAKAAQALMPKMETDSFLHKRLHNVYFRKEVPGLDPDHPALVQFQTTNQTLCADQLADNPVTRIYDYAPLATFLARCMGRAQMHVMADPLARLNVMAYGEGEALNWHFDRAEFTTTLLLQAPDAGGEFVYRTDLRSADAPNYDAVARLLRGDDPAVQVMAVAPGTLNVFKGINTPHKVATVRGPRARVIAVFSYYEREGVRFTSEEQLGFYGRVA